jgi:hypothetical protein
MVRLSSFPSRAVSNYYRTSVYGHRGSVIKRGVPNPVVCGRKFCCHCGRWRHVCDFRPNSRNTRSGLTSLCETCMRTKSREQRARITAKQRARVREYQRLWHYVRRREAGIPERDFKNRHTVIDSPEMVFLPREPLLAALAEVDDWEALARRAGVPARMVFRIRTDTQAHVRLDVADKLAYALGWPLEVIYHGVDTVPIHELHREAS